MINRREFLRHGALLGLAPTMLGATGITANGKGAGGAADASESNLGVQRRVSIGSTGLEISDISFGGSALAGDVSLVEHALRRGINYFDTAGGYAGGRSEETLGRALEGRRQDVVLTSKMRVQADWNRQRCFEMLERSLKRLRTDYVDIYMNHAVNDLSRLQNQEWFEFVDRAKAQGKIRFSGVSGHGGQLIDVLNAAIDESLVDVILAAHNFGQDPAFYERFTKRFDYVAVQPGLPKVLRRAREKGIGVIAMKTLRGARMNDMRPYEAGGVTFAQAAFRWVLSGGIVDALVVTMTSADQIDEYLGASGWTTEHSADVSLLERYAQLNDREQCRYGCNDCVSACPRQVSIPDALRARMYAEDYGEPGLARDALENAGLSGDACGGCDGSPCAAACPHGVEIPELTHRLAELVRP